MCALQAQSCHPRQCRTRLSRRGRGELRQTGGRPSRVLRSVWSPTSRRPPGTLPASACAPVCHIDEHEHGAVGTLQQGGWSTLQYNVKRDTMRRGRAKECILTEYEGSSLSLCPRTRASVCRRPGTSEQARQPTTWGPKPPPHIPAMLRGRLALRVLSSKEGETLAAKVMLLSLCPPNPNRNDLALSASAHLCTERGDPMYPLLASLPPEPPVGGNSLVADPLHTT